MCCAAAAHIAGARHASGGTLRWHCCASVPSQPEPTSTARPHDGCTGCTGHGGSLDPRGKAASCRPAGSGLSGSAAADAWCARAWARLAADTDAAHLANDGCPAAVLPYAEGAKGTLYAAFNTDGSFGVFNEWGSVTGQRFKKHEYSPRAPVSAGKYKSWADARAAALDWLLAGGTTPQRAAVQLARDAERADEQRRDAVRAAEQRSTPERQTDVHTGPVQAGSVHAGPTCVRPRMLPRWMVARQAAEAAQAVQGPAASQAVVKLQRWGRRVGLRQRWRDVVAQAQAQAAEAAERAARTAELRRSQPGKRSAAEKARRNKLQKQRKRQRAQAGSQAEAAVTSAAGDQSEPTDETGATTADGSSAEPLSLCAPQSASAALQEAALREAALRARLAGQKQLNGAIRKRSERESRLAFGRAKRKLQREAAEAKQAKSKQRNVKQLRGVAGSARRTKAALKQQKKARNKQQREKQREEAQPSA